ncbi:MAG: hypothetical protein AAGI71_18690 [Bacteroidota bacterium]
MGPSASINDWLDLMPMSGGVTSLLTMAATLVMGLYAFQVIYPLLRDRWATPVDPALQAEERAAELLAQYRRTQEVSHTPLAGAEDDPGADPEPDGP